MESLSVFLPFQCVLVPNFMAPSAACGTKWKYGNTDRVRGVEELVLLDDKNH
jgi:hypothetical protein